MNIHAEANAAELIREYLTLRDHREQKEKQVAEVFKRYFDDRMNAIEAFLLEKLNNEGAQNIKSKFGTALKMRHAAVTIADGALFRDHVIKGEHWDLLDWRANKTAVKRLVEKQEPAPPGINYSTRYVVNIRKPSS